MRVGHVADYVIDLLAEILGEQPEREKRFRWALGDMSAKTGRRVQLPFDGFWARHSLLVEVDEDQHRRSVAFWDKPSVATVSGVFRGEQRAIYDARKRTAARDAGYTVLEIPWERRPLPRNRDREADRRLLPRSATRAPSSRCRSMRRLCGLFALLFLLCGSASASAQNTTLRVRVPNTNSRGEGLFAGPVLVGDGVAWGEANARGFLLRSADPGGQIRSLGQVNLPFGNTVSAVLAGAPGRLAFSVASEDEDKGMNFTPLFAAVLQGSPQGPLGTVASCLLTHGHRGHNSATCPFCEDAQFTPIAVTTDAFAFGGCSRPLAIASTGPDGSEVIQHPPYDSLLDLKGRWLATRSAGASPVLTVSDWRTGGVLYQIPVKPTTDAVLNEDGSALISLDGRSQIPGDKSNTVVYSTPANPNPRPLPTTGIRADYVGHHSIAAGGDNFVFASAPAYAAHDPLAAPEHIAVVSARGQVRSAPTPTVFGGALSVSADRLTWATRPCAIVNIQVWDLTGPPPAPTPTRCSTPKLFAHRAHTHIEYDYLNGPSLVASIPLACPRRSPQGCIASLKLSPPLPFSGFIPPSGPILIAPGTHAMASLTIGYTDRLLGETHIRRNSKFRATITMTAQGHQHKYKITLIRGRR